MKPVLLLSLILLLYKFSYAQYDDIVFEHLTIEDGLSQSSVRSIFQDSKGFMWFGTNDGLNRYDGYHFKIFKNNIYDSLSLSNNEIYSISEDADGYLWIATADGLNRYDRITETFRHYNILHKDNEHLLSNAIVSVLGYNNKDEKYVWFTTRDGILKYDLTKDIIKRYEFENQITGNNSMLIGLVRDSKNDLWASFYIGGLFKYNKYYDRFDKVTFKEKNNSDFDFNVSPVYEDNGNNLWFGTRGGLHKYNTSAGTVKTYKSIFEKATGKGLENGFVNQIVEDDSKENLLIASPGYGLIIFNKRTESVKININDPYDIKSIGLNVALTLFKDKSGITWIGTNGSGIDRVNPHLNKFKVVTKTINKLSSQSIRTFFEDIYGYIWISGYAGLDRYDPKTGKFVNFFDVTGKLFPRLTNNIAYSIAEDRDYPSRFIYFGTEGSGLNMYDYKKNVFTKIYPPFFDPSEPGNNIIYSMYDDGNGYLWIGTNHALVKMDKKTREYISFHHNPDDPESIGPQNITVLYEDSYGNFWIGTNLGGLNLMDRNKNKFSSFQYKPGDNNSISGNFIKCIFEDSKRNLWIGTASGLNKFNRESKTFKRYTSKDGLPNDVIYGILEDKRGNLWLSTNLGLSKFNPAKESFVNYDVKDGLQSNEFNTNAYYKTRNGEMFFGGINGYNSFFPENIKKNQNIPPVVITDFQLFNKSLEIGGGFNGKTILKNSIIETKEIEISYLDNVITIEFAAMDYASSNKNLYSYKLEGFDKSWSAPRQKRTVTYTNLNPGKYTFRVIGSNNDGAWNNQGAALKIIVRPPFWLTWWFYILSAIIVILGIYLVYIYRIRAIKKANRKLELLVKERTLELNSVNESLKNEVQERKNAEKELRVLNIQKDKFFSIIAHDLKSPFYGLLGYSELLSEEYDRLTEEEKVTFIKDIQSITKNTYRFLENLLEWSRIQTGRIDISPEKVCLHQEVSNIINIHYGHAAQKRINLKNEVDPSVLVFADQNMLNLILRNLISNAIKFTNYNGSIRVYSVSKGSFIETVVEDNGIGISPEDLEKLFRIDIQYSSRGTKEEEGTGLGLLLCKEMVELNKGTIRVESVLTKGTNFIFSLPAHS